MNANAEALFDELDGTGGNLGIITLNRQSVLNSLNLSMIHAIHKQLQSWMVAEHIKAVVIRAAEGRAFCAGGDLRLTHQQARINNPALSHFFHDEYQLNRLIFHYPKPYIALLDGITMGGGAGISVHGSHRIATERLMFAMPETGIGFFPDVGGTYFLPRLPGNLGVYLGLTGARLTGDDCVALGITQQKVAQETLPDLIQALAQQPFNNNARDAVTSTIHRFKMITKPSLLLEQQQILDSCFSHASVEEIVQALSQTSSPLCEEAIIALAQKSPTSLKVTLRALQKGKQLDFDRCMEQEQILTNHFIQGHDFPEGIRALIVDKDKHPHWQPSSLAEVTVSQVETYFRP